jgi:hypothetical protein
MNMKWLNTEFRFPDITGHRILVVGLGTLGKCELGSGGTGQSSALSGAGGGTVSP